MQYLSAAASGASPAGRKRPLPKAAGPRESGRPPRARSAGSEPSEERGEH